MGWKGEPGSPNIGLGEDRGGLVIPAAEFKGNQVRRRELSRHFLNLAFFLPIEIGPAEVFFSHLIFVM